MSQWEDFLLAILLQILALLFACWLAWKVGKPISKKVQQFVRFVPFIFLLYAFVAVTDALWPEVKHSHPWLLMRRTGDAVLMLIAAGFAAVYSWIAPLIFAAGAKHHPAPVFELSAAQIHLRRKVRKSVVKQSVPLLALGIGVGVIAIICGYHRQNGEWIVLGFLGIGVWQIIMALLIDSQIRKQVQLTEKV